MERSPNQFKTRQKWKWSFEVECVKNNLQAGAIAEEVLASIRTVVAFGGQKKEVQRLRYFEVTLLCCEYLYN